MFKEQTFHMDFLGNKGRHNIIKLDPIKFFVLFIYNINWLKLLIARTCDPEVSLYCSEIHLTLIMHPKFH